MVDQQKMLAQLKLHEGLELKPYPDTEGYITVLIGFNVSARGWGELSRILGRTVGPDSVFTEVDAEKVCLADIARIESRIRAEFPEYDTHLNEVRQRVVVDMAFNIAYRLRDFKKAKAAIQQRNWSEWARQLYNSRWAKQVGDGLSPEQGGRFGREDRLAKMALTGLDFNV